MLEKSKKSKNPKKPKNPKKKRKIQKSKGPKGGPKGLRLEVGARRAPELLVFNIYHISSFYSKICFQWSFYRVFHFKKQISKIWWLIFIKFKEKRWNENEFYKNWGNYVDGAGDLVLSFWFWFPWIAALNSITLIRLFRQDTKTLYKVNIFRHYLNVNIY